jgi:hypothetical protein
MGLKYEFYIRAKQEGLSNPNIAEGTKKTVFGSQHWIPAGKEKRKTDDDLHRAATWY